ncbi:MAG: hypothetical protein AAF664_21030, partial [Planctomycetota bacterium]
EGYFRDAFRERISPFASNHFEVTEALIGMAKVAGYPSDIEHWRNLVSLQPNDIRKWFVTRWQANGHANLFAGPKDGMLMTNSFWHLRSKHFPRDYALKMTSAWATNNDKGFLGYFFPLAMSRQSMKKFETDVDHSFGYTPDTAYFTLSGIFRQHLGDPAWKLTLNHLENYNFHTDWNIPVAPEAYTRSGDLFGDQYSNFNAGKLLLFLEGLAGLEYSIPDNRLVVRDCMPKTWQWMEFRVPVTMPDEKQTQWTKIRFERTRKGDSIEKSIAVSDCPLGITIEPWTEHENAISISTVPTRVDPKPSTYPNHQRFVFRRSEPHAQIRLRISSALN